jgi:hypothetical protein
MMFEGFAPTFAPPTAQELVRLKVLRNRVLGVVMASGSVCALIRALLML